VINQALAAGMPVITSDAVGAGLDLVDDCHNGLRVPANHVGELYRAMSALAKDPLKMRAYGEASRRKADDLTPEAGAAKWVRVFETLAAESKNTQ
jgi:glycosyltransferase involved in cell wall biosynthesis